MSDTDESNIKTMDDAVILSEVEHAENSLNVNKTSDNKCDPLFKDTCTDNENDSVNEKKRHISDNENNDEETLHPNKKYKSCANTEQSAELQEVNKESDVLSSAISSNEIDVTDNNKEVSDSVNVPIIPLENTPKKESLSEEKSNEQKSQGNDTTKISKFDSDTDAAVNDENLESKNKQLKTVNGKILKHIETTEVLVRCDRMNFEKYFEKKSSNTEKNRSSSENEETSKKVSEAKKLKKRKGDHKIAESLNSESENVKNKKKLPKNKKMVVENSNVEFMDCNETKNDNFVTLNNSKSKISEQEISDLINTDSNDEKLNQDTSCESDNDSGINIAKINKKKLSKDSGIESESLKNEKNILDPESDNLNSSDESKSRTKTKKLPKKSPGEKSMDSESDNSDNESHNKKVLKKSAKINEKKANLKNVNANSRKNDSDSEESDKEIKNSSGSESEKDENSDKENYKSSGSESKSRTKKLSKKSTNNNSKEETDSDNEDDVDDKSDKEDQLTKNEKLSETDSKSKRNPERGIERLKKFLRIAGIHVNNFGKLFDNIKTIKGKERKLLGLLEENGLEGRPTIKKCEELRKKNDIAKEIAELDTSNIIAIDSRPKRGTPFRQRQRRSPTPDPNQYQRTFNRIRALVDSDSD